MDSLRRMDWGSVLRLSRANETSENSAYLLHVLFNTFLQNAHVVAQSNQLRSALWYTAQMSGKTSMEP